MKGTKLSRTNIQIILLILHLGFFMKIYNPTQSQDVKF